MNKIVYSFVVLTFTVTMDGLADVPNVQTPAPVIYLADNLDEADNLGWCIDTQGRGFSDKLHAHSCKPRGGDVQFSLNEETGQIMSVEFADFCMEYREEVDVHFSLVTCNSDSPGQRFQFDRTTSHISLLNQPEKCVVVGNASRTAGPFMSRELLLADCASTNAELRQWVVVK